MKKSIVLALVILATPVAMPANAVAADVAPRLVAKAPAYTDVYSWTGIYLSGYADYGANFGTNQIGLASFSTSPHGPGLGGMLSLLYQLPSSPWVVGLRGDLGWANMQGSAASPVVSVNGLGALSVSSATNYLGSINGILGYTPTADQKLLAYLTGGFGFGGAKTSAQFNLNAQGVSDTSVGYDIGAGLSYALTANLALFLEGDYFQLGGKSVTLTDPATGLPVATSNAAYDIFTQKAGISFKIP
jgi:opacity protein-like surface antigen